MTEPLSIGVAAGMLERRELSATELLEQVLARLDETEPLVHAYAHVDRDGALAAAREAERAPRRGPLHGIPFAVKDVLEARGLPAEAGSRVLAGNVAARDATAVARLRDVGAVLVGKHVTHEFAGGQNTPPTRNPWNLDHYPGGSSAGSGVSVAVGSSLFALGTDAGGSVRKPAAVTSVVGLKATHGRVSSRGTLLGASAPSLDHVGVFARTVEDAALVMEAIAGHDPPDRRSLAEPVPALRESLGAGVRGLRLGLPREMLGFADLDIEIAALVEAAVRELEGLGATLVEVRLPRLELALPAAFTILMCEAAGPHRRWLNDRPYDYVPGTRHLFELGLILPAAHLDAAERARQAFRSSVAQTFDESRIDALLTPTLPCTSMPVEELVPSRDLGGLIPFTAPWNLTGQPAVSVPCGFTRAGLPAGLQIVGRHLDEPTVLRVGHAYESVTDWHRRAPPLRPAVSSPRAAG